MANTKKSSTKSTTTNTKTKSVPAKKPAKKPAGATKKPATYKEATAKTPASTTKSSTKTQKSKKHTSEVIFGIIMIILALVIAAGTIFYFCCGRDKDVVKIQTEGDAVITTRYVEVEDYKVKVLIPDNFKKMSKKEIEETTFNLSEEVTTAYASNEKGVIISVGKVDAQISNDGIKNYTNALKSAFITANAKDVTTKFYEADGHNVGVLSFSNPQVNESYPYCQVAIFSQDDQVVAVAFETNNEAHSSWEKVGDAILTALRFTDQK